MSTPDSILQFCFRFNNEQLCSIILVLVCAHASHHHMCAVACVYSIFINSYFYSEPCRFQSILSKPRIQPKHHREEQREDRQLWKGAAPRPTEPLDAFITSQDALSLTHLYWSLDSQIPRPLSLIGSTLRFDKLDQAETRSLLMCFLHIMKTISVGKRMISSQFKRSKREKPTFPKVSRHVVSF